MSQFIYTRFPIFDLRINLLNDCINQVEFLEKDTISVSIEHSDWVKTIVSQLDSYIKDAGFQFNLPLSISGTMHQKLVWQELLLIKSGNTLSYTDVANKINSGARVVGNACGQNKIPLFIPCHRVITANKKLGGFMQSSNGYNLAIKNWLLNHEGVNL
jgi:methylated-DNA-[protein]-cysteine S-methyltransferase